MKRLGSAIRGWVTGPMVLSLAVFGTLPLWIEQIGLYQYLGVEIIIWVIFALAVNLLLGYTGLPPFGHGAFLGLFSGTGAAAATWLLTVAEGKGGLLGVVHEFPSVMAQNFWIAIKDRKSTRLNSSHSQQSRMPSSA